MIRRLKIIAGVLVLVVTTIIVLRAFDARSLPELSIWHEARLGTEVRADDALETLAAYLDAERALFGEVDREILAEADVLDLPSIHRFNRTSPYNARNHAKDWNRTTELVAEDPRGTALLLHGLTDSPYSMRTTAELLRAEGFHVLVPRLPGHGTAPAGIAAASWEDWRAVARLGARHLSSAASGRPFIIVGYSNGGAVALDYVLDAAEDAELPQANRLILLSPEIGITPFARFATWNRMLSWTPYFRKFAWESVLPEYDPYKYNSFPKAAGAETYEITQRIQKRMRGLAERGSGSALPPILTFAPIVDATVRTDATVDHVYDTLNRPDDELVLYDINRFGDIAQFMRGDHDELLKRIETDTDRAYRLTVVGNRSRDTRAVAAVTHQEGLRSEEPIPDLWPVGVYSLSHVALPFPADDPWYGDGSANTDHVSLGALNPYGERDLLAVSPAQIMRLRYNPFYDYQARRIVETIEALTD